MNVLPAYKTPAFKYGWLPVATQVITPGSVTLPTNTWVACSNTLAEVSNAQMEAVGVNFHWVNPDGANVNTPQSTRCALPKGNGLWEMMTQNGGRSWTLANQSEMESFADSVNLHKFMCDEFGEKLVERGVDYPQWLASNQYLWLAQRLKTRVHAIGGRYGGDYGGHLDSTTSFFNDLDAVRNAFASNSAAHSYAVAHSGFGNRYFSGGHGAWREGLIKAYLKGEPTGCMFVFSNLTDLLIDRMAKAHAGFTLRTALIGWDGHDERQGVPYTGQIYERTTPEGAILRRSAPSFAYLSGQVFLKAMAIKLGFDVIGWTEPGFFGSNPSICYPPNSMGGIAGVSLVSGTIAQTAFDTQEPGQLPAGYPYSPKGGNDVTPAAAHLASYGYSHAGNSAFRFLPTKINGGSASTVAASYVPDQYAGQKVLAIEWYVDNKRTVDIYNGNEGHTSCQISFTPTGGTEQTIKSYGNTYDSRNYTI